MSVLFSCQGTQSPAFWTSAWPSRGLLVDGRCISEADLGFWRDHLK